MKNFMAAHVIFPIFVSLDVYVTLALSKLTNKNLIQELTHAFFSASNHTPKVTLFMIFTPIISLYHEISSFTKIISQTYSLKHKTQIIPLPLLYHSHMITHILIFPLQFHIAPYQHYLLPLLLIVLFLPYVVQQESNIPPPTFKTTIVLSLQPVLPPRQMFGIFSI